MPLVDGVRIGRGSWGFNEAAAVKPRKLLALATATPPILVDALQ